MHAARIGYLVAKQCDVFRLINVRLTTVGWNIMYFFCKLSLDYDVSLKQVPTIFATILVTIMMNLDSARD